MSPPFPDPPLFRAPCVARARAGARSTPPSKGRARGPFSWSGQRPHEPGRTTPDNFFPRQASLMPSRPPLQRISMSTRSIGRLAACIGVCALAFATVPALAEDASATRSAATAGAIVPTEDVDLFYRIYDAADGHPTAEQLQHDHLDPGSDGLQVLAREPHVTRHPLAPIPAHHQP